jgi:hypothetical protein
MYITNNTELWQRGYSYSNYTSSIQVMNARSRASYYDKVGGFRVIKLSKKKQ